MAIRFLANYQIFLRGINATSSQNNFEGCASHCRLAVTFAAGCSVALQPVVLVLIGAIAYEDGQAMKAEAAAAATKPQA